MRREDSFHLLTAMALEYNHIATLRQHSQTFTFTACLYTFSFKKIKFITKANNYTTCALLGLLLLIVLIETFFFFWLYHVFEKYHKLLFNN